MELALTIVTFFSDIVTLLFIASTVVELVAEASISRKVFNMILTEILFFLQVQQLICKVCLGKDYTFTIFGIVMYATFIAISLHSIRKFKECKQAN